MQSFKSFLALLLVLILAVPIDAAASFYDRSLVTSRGCATWLWHTYDIVHNTDAIIDFLTQNDVKDLYLQVDYDLEFERYRQFIKKAWQSQINVHVLEGAPEWAGVDGPTLWKNFYEWVNSYQENAGESEQFKGIHLDIEPYLKKQYKTDKDLVLERYQDALTDALTQSESLNLPLSVSIPFWFDEVSYNTKYGRGGMAEWIISRIRHIAIMSYRDKASGRNGMINLALKEIELAERYGATIIIGAETQRTDEGSLISFYEEGHRHMYAELEKVYNYYEANSSFGGFAIHHLNSWMNLRE